MTRFGDSAPLQCMLSGECTAQLARYARLAGTVLGRKTPHDERMRREQADLRRLRYYGHGGRSGYECMLADARRYPGRVRGYAPYLSAHMDPTDPVARLSRMPRTGVDRLSGRIG